MIEAIVETIVEATEEEAIVIEIVVVVEEAKGITFILVVKIKAIIISIQTSSVLFIKNKDMM